MICFVIGSRIIYTLFISIQYFSRFWRLALLRPDPGRSTQEETNTKPPVFGFTAFFHFQSTTKIITRARTFNIIETIQHDLAHDKPGKKKPHWSTIWCTTKPGRKKKTRIGARFGARQNPEKKQTHWSTIWCTTNREKKHALEHGLVHETPQKKDALERDLVHDRPWKKNTHWSTIWCTTSREKKHALEHNVVHDKPRKKQQYNIYIYNVILALAQQQTWQTSR